MGRYSQQRRRGGVRQGFALGAPGTAEWSLTVVSDVRIDIPWTAPPPAPADEIAWLLRIHGTGSWVGPQRSPNNPAQQPGLTPATTYDFRIAWSDPTTTLSEWSDIKTATTLT